MKLLETNPTFLSAAYWDDRYQQHQTGWDIGHISTPLQSYFDQLTNKEIRILIPGAGNSYEARYLSEMGFSNIVIVDISSALTNHLSDIFTQHSFPNVTIVTGDFFTMEGEFDLIIEQTFFCALDPSLRSKYVAKMQSLLSLRGKMVGLLFNKEFDTNPPFGGNIEEYRQLFSSGLRILKLEACYNSIPARNGTELFFITEKLNNSI